MFCTQCGTQLDQGKNFCKNCGARVSQATAASSGAALDPIEPTATATPSETSSRRAVAMTPTPARESGGNNRLIIGAAGVAVIVLAATGVYFGTDLFKPPASATPPRVAEPMTQTTEAPPLPSFEDTKDPGPAADNSAAVKPPLPFEPAPPTAEPSKPSLESPPKPVQRADIPPAPTQSQMQRAGQDAPAQGRAARSQPPVPSSRSGGAAAGIYETRRATSVYEEPSASAKTVASIPQGTRVNVVSSSGDWLEVHSKRGNPPGFIRRDDAAFIEKSN
jgi:hypothetical protein